MYKTREKGADFGPIRIEKLHVVFSGKLQHLCGLFGNKNRTDTGETLKWTKEMRLTISRKTCSQKIFRQKTEKVQVTKLPEYSCDWKRFFYKCRKFSSFA